MARIGLGAMKQMTLAAAVPVRWTKFLLCAVATSQLGNLCKSHRPVIVL